MAPVSMTLSDLYPRFQGHGDAFDELCAQVTRDLFAIVKFLYKSCRARLIITCSLQVILSTDERKVPRIQPYLASSK